MKKIIVIGNSIAGVRALEEIRTLDKESEITVFCEDSHLPYQSHLFGDLLAKEITEEKMFYKPASFYKDQNINMVLNKKIARIDFKKSKVTTEEKESFAYDLLLVAGAGAFKLPDVKGINKMGIFGLKKLSDIKDILAILHLVETVTIQADNIAALKMAYGLKKRGKEVLIIIPTTRILSSLIDQEPSEIIMKNLEENGVSFVKETVLSEILGDGDVKAVRLKTGKVIASQMVIVDKRKPELKIFQDTILDVNQGIRTDEFLKTNIENVFAVDNICELKDKGIFNVEQCGITSLEEQGNAVGLTMSGHATTYTPSLRSVSFGLFDFSVQLLGRTKSETGLKEFVKSDTAPLIYKKIFVSEGCLVGAVLINVSAKERDRFIKLIREKADVSPFEGRLLEEGFDASQEGRQPAQANAPQGVSPLETGTEPVNTNRIV